MSLKKPWLLTQNGQRSALWVANLLSMLLLLAVVLQFNLVEMPRQQVSNLNPASISECALMECGKIQDLAGLEPVEITVVESANINQLRVRFVNHGKLIGRRELWLELRDSNGVFLEAAKTNLELIAKGRLVAEFGFTTAPAQIKTGSLTLKY
jgi:hypothetical protein